MSGGIGDLAVTLPQLSVGPVAGISGNAGNVTLPPMNAAPAGPISDQQALVNTARQIGVDPHDLATVVHFESGFRPNAVNPDGIHTGLIQFGKTEQNDYGVNRNQSFQQQLPAVANFLQDRGFKPGMSFLDLYSTINAGSPGKYNAVDGSTNVAQKVAGMASNRAAAAKWLSQDPATAMTPGAANAGMSVGSTAMQGGFGLNGIQAQGGPVGGQSAPTGVSSLVNQPMTAMGPMSSGMAGLNPGGSAATPDQQSLLQKLMGNNSLSSLTGAAGGLGKAGQQGQQKQGGGGMNLGQPYRPSPVGLQQAQSMFDPSRFYQMLSNANILTGRPMTPGQMPQAGGQ